MKMKSVLKLLGIVAAVAAIGFSMTSCGDNGGGGFGVPAELVGMWENASWHDIEFEANGWMYYSLGLSSGSARVSTSGNRISGGGIAFDFDLSNSNNTLTISNQSGITGLNGVWTRIE